MKTELRDVLKVTWYVCQVEQRVGVIDLLLRNQCIVPPNSSFLFLLYMVSTILGFLLHGPNSCLLLSMCVTYAEVGLLCLM